MGDFAKGFVHVLDEHSVSAVLEELDTISDFVDYLIAKESLWDSGVQTIVEMGEEDLLGVYLHNGRKFPSDATLILIRDGLWEIFTGKAEYKAKKLANIDSYVWDRLIEIISEDILKGHIEFGASLTDAELAVRTMARERRFSRRILGQSFKEFFDLSSQGEVRSRIIPGLSEVIYVFLAVPHGVDRAYRMAELANRCFVARGLHQQFRTVVGIATERYERGLGYSFDFVYLNKEVWAHEDESQLHHIQQELGYFTKLTEKTNHYDEYPMN